MNEKTHIIEQELLGYALQSNQPAIEMCNSFFQVSQTWDDLADKDQDVTAQQVNKMVVTVLEICNMSPFYRQYSYYLFPVIMDGIIDWMNANDLEHSQSADDKIIAYTLRDSFNSLVTHCAYLIGGFDWMNEVRMQVLQVAYDEPLQDYLEGLQQ